MEPFQKYLFMLLYAKGASGIAREPVTGQLWLQKEMFLISKNMGDFADEFEAYYLGPFSELLESNIKQLALSGYVQQSGKIGLTPKGEKIATEVWTNASDEERTLITEIKETLNNLSNNELLAFIYQSYPDMTVHSKVKDDIDKQSKKLAISLFKGKKVSLEKAAEIAKLSVKEFSELLKQNNIPSYLTTKKQFDVEQK